MTAKKGQRAATLAELKERGRRTKTVIFPPDTAEGKKQQKAVAEAEELMPLVNLMTITAKTEAEKTEAAAKKAAAEDALNKARTALESICTRVTVQAVSGPDRAAIEQSAMKDGDDLEEAKNSFGTVSPYLQEVLENMLVAASVVEPAMTAEDVAELRSLWGDQDFTVLVDAVEDVCGKTDLRTRMGN